MTNEVIKLEIDKHVDMIDILNNSQLDRIEEFQQGRAFYVRKYAEFIKAYTAILEDYKTIYNQRRYSKLTQKAASLASNLYNELEDRRQV